MKKTNQTTTRKHGYNARAAVISSRLHLNSDRDVATPHAGPGRRLKTELTCSATGKTYFWLTDRGRSRLIKH